MTKNLFSLIVFAFLLLSCKEENSNLYSAEISTESDFQTTTDLTEKQIQISNAALSIIDPSIIYDTTYFQIPYPNGDVPATKGVCTDVVIRTYRKLGVDLQEKVHQDMKANFGKYPKTWGLSKPDTNIDHRRVPNLMVFFGRFGKEKPISNNPEDYHPGDIVAWRLPNGMTHIGMVVDKKMTDGNRYQIVHNIGSGQIAEDILFDFDIIGHYSYEEFEL